MCMGRVQLRGTYPLWIICTFETLAVGSKLTGECRVRAANDVFA